MIAGSEKMIKREIHREFRKLVGFVSFQVRIFAVFDCHPRRLFIAISVLPLMRDIMWVSREAFVDE